MDTEFDLIFDEICEDAFPKIKEVIAEDGRYKVDINNVISYLTDEEGYNTDMAVKIWDSYKLNLHRKEDAPISTIAP